MSNLKDKVPLGYVRGSDVFITVEWYRNLTNALDALVASEGLTPTQIKQLASLSTLISNVATNTANLTALTARVKALEGGYQS